ncbi:hypothetical protein PMIN02_007089 [Paraphaeosphaeria minitans]
MCKVMYDKNNPEHVGKQLTRDPLNGKMYLEEVMIEHHRKQLELRRPSVAPRTTKSRSLGLKTKPTPRIDVLRPASGEKHESAPSLLVDPLTSTPTSKDIYNGSSLNGGSSTARKMFIPTQKLSSDESWEDLVMWDEEMYDPLFQSNTTQKNATSIFAKDGIAQKERAQSGSGDGVDLAEQYIEHGPISTLDEGGSSGENRGVTHTKHKNSRVAELTGDVDDQPRAPAGGTLQLLQPNPYAQVNPPGMKSQPSAPIGMRPSPILHANHVEGALRKNADSHPDPRTTDSISKTSEFPGVGPFPATYLNTLGLHLEDRHSWTEEMVELEEATQVTKQAVDATPEDHLVPDSVSTEEPEVQSSPAGPLSPPIMTTLPHFEDDNASAMSLYATSVYSVLSVASTGTDFSRNSEYGADEITTVTRKVVQMFHKDESQESLYVLALRDPAIGPAKLERNLRRLFKQCAEDLKNEAKDQLEYLGARLVSHQAKILADIIVSRYGAFPRVRVANEESSDQEEQEESKEVFGETLFADLRAFITFLESSEALRRFQERLKRFISPDPALYRDLTTRPIRADPETFNDPYTPRPDLKIATVPKIEDPEGDTIKASNTDDQHKIESLRDTLQVVKSSSRMQEKSDILVSPLEPIDACREVRTVQLRWQCRCKKSFESNVTELLNDGVLDLVKRMERSIGCNVTITTAPANPSLSTACSVLWRRRKDWTWVRSGGEVGVRLSLRDL